MDEHLMRPAASKSHPQPLQMAVEPLRPILLSIEQMKLEENGERSVTNCQVGPGAQDRCRGRKSEDCPFGRINLITSLAVTLHCTTTPTLTATTSTISASTPAYKLCINHKHSSSCKEERTVFCSWRWCPVWHPPLIRVSMRQA